MKKKECGFEKNRQDIMKKGTRLRAFCNVLRYGNQFSSVGAESVVSAVAFLLPQLRMTRNLLPKKLMTSAAIPPTACPARLNNSPSALLGVGFAP